MKKIFSIILVNILFVSILFAEKIDGPAYIRSQAQGVVMFILNDNVEVVCSDLDYGWYHIGIITKVTKEQWESKVILRGSAIQDESGRVIGKAQENCQIVPIAQTQSNPELFFARLTGYAYKTNIRSRSIPEEQLSVIVNPQSDTLNMNTLKPFFNEFKFIQKGILKGSEYTEFMIFEEWVDNPSPMDRMRFIFQDNKLIAIVHARNLVYGNYLVYDLVKGRKITLIKEMNKTELDLFLKQNKAAYLGIY